MELRIAAVSVPELPNLDVLNAIAPLFPGGQLDTAAQTEIDQITRKVVDQIIALEGRASPKLYPRGSSVATWALLLSPFVKHAAFREER